MNYNEQEQIIKSVTTQRIIWNVIYLIGILLQILLSLFVSNFLPFVFTAISVICIVTSAKLNYDAITGIQTQTRISNYARAVELAEWGGYGFLVAGFIAIILMVL